MKKALIIGAILGILLAGCSAETEKADGTGPGEKQNVEASAPVIEDKYTAVGIPKAASVNQEITLEVLNEMSDEYVVRLGNCQLIKYRQENGGAAMDKWMDDFVDEVASASSGDVVSVQEAMINKGYSCTFQEMNQVATAGTLGEQ